MSPLALSIGQLGLLFDIAGAIFLGRALFFNKLAMIAAQGGTYFDYNKHLIRALCEQRIDALFGLPLLCAGFAFQLAGTWYSDVNLAWTGLGGTLLLGCVLSYLALRPVLVERLSDRVITFIQTKNQP